jgi:hypothetical protein
MLEARPPVFHHETLAKNSRAVMAKQVLKVPLVAALSLTEETSAALGL